MGPSTVTPGLLGQWQQHSEEATGVPGGPGKRAVTGSQQGGLTGASKGPHRDGRPGRGWPRRSWEGERPAWCEAGGRGSQAVRQGWAERSGSLRLPALPLALGSASCTPTSGLTPPQTHSGTTALGGRVPPCGHSGPEDSHGHRDGCGPARASVQRGPPSSEGPGLLLRLSPSPAPCWTQTRHCHGHRHHSTAPLRPAAARTSTCGGSPRRRSLDQAPR